jgi:hypothetical protein
MTGSTRRRPLIRMSAAMSCDRNNASASHGVNAMSAQRSRTQIHPFVRSVAKVNGKTQQSMYYGQLAFERWQAKSRSRSSGSWRPEFLDGPLLAAFGSAAAGRIWPLCTYQSRPMPMPNGFNNIVPDCSALPSARGRLLLTIRLNQHVVVSTIGGHWECDSLLDRVVCAFR